MNDRFSNAFIFSQGKKYLNLSGAFWGYDLGYHPPHFTKRAKNYLKQQNPHFKPCAADINHFLFLYKAIPWLEEFPYLYLFENPKEFLEDRKFSFDPNQLYLEKIDAEFHSHLSLLNKNQSMSISSENFLRFNPYPEKKDFIFIHSLLFLLENNFSDASFISICPNLGLAYPVKNLLFSKENLSLELGSCEISRRLYRDFFEFIKNKNILKNIELSSHFFKEDLEMFSDKIEKLVSSKNYFKVQLKKPISATLDRISNSPFSLNDSFAFIHQDNTLYLSPVYHKNPAIFQKKLRKLLTSII